MPETIGVELAGLDRTGSRSNDEETLCRLLLVGAALAGLVACGGEEFSGEGEQRSPEAGAAGESGSGGGQTGGSSGVATGGASGSVGGSMPGAGSGGEPSNGGSSTGGAGGSGAPTGGAGSVAGAGVTGGAGGAPSAGAGAGGTSGKAGAGPSVPEPCPGGTLVTIPVGKCARVTSSQGFFSEGPDSCDVQGRMPQSCATVTNVGQFESYPPNPDEHCSSVNRCENPGYISIRPESDGDTFTVRFLDLVDDRCPEPCTN